MHGRKIYSFIWDTQKELLNIKKHGVDFRTAERAFADKDRKIYADSAHSDKEPRHYCLGKVGDKILTVRFTYRKATIRIIGAGYWRKGSQIYAKGK